MQLSTLRKKLRRNEYEKQDTLDYLADNRCIHRLVRVVGLYIRYRIIVQH